MFGLPDEESTPQVLQCFVQSTLKMKDEKLSTVCEKLCVGIVLYPSGFTPDTCQKLGDL